MDPFDISPSELRQTLSNCPSQTPNDILILATYKDFDGKFSVKNSITNGIFIFSQKFRAQYILTDCIPDKIVCHNIFWLNAIPSQFSRQNSYGSIKNPILTSEFLTVPLWSKSPSKWRLFRQNAYNIRSKYPSKSALFHIVCLL